MKPPPVKPPPRPRCAVDARIDANLRRIFAQDIATGVPDHLQALVRQLDAASLAQAGASRGPEASE